MAEHQRLPDINVIRDTPTSPEHGLHREYAAPRLPRLDSDNAPEAIVESQGLQVDEHGAYPQPTVESERRDASGLQVDPNGPYPQPTTNPNGNERFAYYAPEGMEKVAQRDDAGLVPLDTEKRNGRRERLCRLKRRTFIIIVVVVAIVIVAGAVGGGVGGYFANKDDSSSTDNNNDAVTTGTTGMAALPCMTATAPPSQTTFALANTDFTPRDIPNPYLTTGATFNITCRRGVPPSGTRAGRPITNLGRFVEYNFTSCMDRCAQDSACRGVVYGANLTAMLADGDPAGNCLLKNGTWDAKVERDYWFASGVKK
ncbi:hypothetical protein EJ04DRAFT_509195 [Polyplosphaeria fusca]|uniref:Apple domain-containing protein n=1 Tax=Polyplosphaeria fusca TaxID=682080 RepID=A0A9P4R9T6_9PLEO|nr:hypothetical protein EJ04DRAFT_509195 [Polyplosphaeria fusca]